MSGIEAPSLTGHLMMLLTFRNIHVVRETYVLVSNLYRERYDVPTSLALRLLFPSDAPRLVGRIEKVLQAEPQQAKEFVNSLASGFNLIGVAGAIVAQIAITGVGVDSPDNLSWTVSACYVIGLVCSAFAVYFACVVHPAFTGLDDPVLIRKWLGQPRRSHGLENGADQQAQYASAYAVMMILAPSRLLNIAIGSLLVGFGIHLGLLYTKNASPGFHDFGQLAVLIVYVCTGVYALGIYFFPDGLKEMEICEDRLNIDATPSPNEHQTPAKTHPGHRVATRRWSKDTLSETHELQANISRTDTAIAQVWDDRRPDGSVPGHSKDPKDSEGLEMILRELVLAQDRCANITRKLLEYQQGQAKTTVIGE